MPKKSYKPIVQKVSRKFQKQAFESLKNDPTIQQLQKELGINPVGHTFTFEIAVKSYDIPRACMRDNNYLAKAILRYAQFYEGHKLIDEGSCVFQANGRVFYVHEYEMFYMVFSHPE